MEEAADLANGGLKHARFSRQHEHFANGGTGREWDHKKDQYEISKERMKQMEEEQLREQKLDREYDAAGNGMRKGPMLSNGKYEWIARGGGRKMYWDDRRNDYV